MKKKTTLTGNEVRKVTDAMMKIFEIDRAHNIVYITDNIVLYLVGAYGVTSEQAYVILDKYNRLQDTYKGMVYQHMLYKRGEITEHQFITMCRGIYHTGEIKNEN